VKLSFRDVTIDDCPAVTDCTRWGGHGLLQPPRGSPDEIAAGRDR
jgi:hypothetical protein